MVRFRTTAALVGLLAGLWAVGGSYLGGIGRACPPTALECPSPNLFLVGLGALVLVSSIVCFFGPELVFYATAILSILLAGLILGTSTLNDPVVDVALALSVLAFAVGVVAARRTTEVSEQANPMN